MVPPIFRSPHVDRHDPIRWKLLTETHEPLNTKFATLTFKKLPIFVTPKTLEILPVSFPTLTNPRTDTAEPTAAECVRLMQDENRVKALTLMVLPTRTLSKTVSDCPTFAG
jgi:hypothetical protein